MKRALILAAILLSTTTANAGGFWSYGQRGFTYGQSTPGYTWTTGPSGYTFYSHPNYQPYRQPVNYYGGFGNTYRSYNNYGTVYSPQFNYYGRR
jgi:hypothetical protein